MKNDLDEDGTLSLDELEGILPRCGPDEGVNNMQEIWREILKECGASETRGLT
jgi:hypothetical protein